MSAPTPRRVSRRKFLRRCALGTVAALPGYAWAIEPHWVEVVRLRLPVANLPPALVGRRLVQISDLHIGPVVDREYITEAVVRAGNLLPDILVITGDLMTCHGDEQVGSVIEVLRRLRPARLATLAILGNHDYGHGYRQTGAADRLARGLADLGIDVLRNEIRDVTGLQIAGLDDYWSPRYAPDAVLPRLDPQRPALVLCHNPDVADEDVWGGYRGWILCGHTHGGQCKPPFFDPPILPVRNPLYTRGQIDLGDGRTVYINAGLGYTKRIRFNVRPEITVFTLVRDS